jgi:GNAT superfamily N-acetyltransferase
MLSFRYEPCAADREAIRRLTDSTGVFYPVEIDIAVELVDERLAKGPSSGYEFVFAHRDGQTVGYACYGAIALTAASYDLFWIAVDKSCQGQGVGRLLLEESERLIRARGGQRVYIETSGRPIYEPTRAFYLRCGYALAALLDDFYAPGDPKAIFVKAL